MMCLDTTGDQAVIEPGKTSDPPPVTERNHGFL